MKDLPAADLVVRPAHLCLALNCTEQTLAAWTVRRQFPQPDGRDGRLRMWRLRTIRAWNAGIADSVEQLLKIPGFAPRPRRRWNQPILPIAA